MTRDAFVVWIQENRSTACNQKGQEGFKARRSQFDTALQHDAAANE